jgi:hypothetical protein
MEFNMGMHVELGEFVAVPQYASSFADMADMQAMFFRAQLIQALVIEQLTLLALLGAMTMPQTLGETEFHPFAGYNVFPETGSSSPQQRTERVFQRTFYQPQESAKAQYTPPPAPHKITPEATPETLAFIQKVVPAAKNGDPYSFLGLTSAATTEEVRKMYKKSVLKFHPDKFAGDKQAEEAFKVVQGAYEMIIPPNEKPLS